MLRIPLLPYLHVRRQRVLAAALFSAACCLPMLAQEAPTTDDGPAMHPAPIVRQAAPATDEAPPPPEAAHQPLPTAAPYDPAIFQKAIPPAELASLLGDDGLPAGQVYKDHALHKLLHSAAPSVMFHYGRDVSLPETLDMMLNGSATPTVVREGRYVSLAGTGASTPWMRHDGRLLLWTDAHDGVMLGAFFFHPTNGEPSPTVTIFTKMIKQDGIGVSELPPAFFVDLERWERANGIPTVSILYFIGDANRKLMLEHDNDFCLYNDSASGPPMDCDQMNADAADDDMTAASYLEQVHYATNATAWMINDPEQVQWVSYRNNTCNRGPNPLNCRVVMTRERIRKIAPRPVRGHR